MNWRVRPYNQWPSLPVFLIIVLIAVVTMKTVERYGDHTLPEPIEDFFDGMGFGGGQPPSVPLD
jgi:hypothetical protein